MRAARIISSFENSTTDIRYFDPAVRRAQQVGVTGTLGQLIIWDTVVQHGEGDDPDGLPAIQNEVVTRFGAVAGNEAAWLMDSWRFAERTC